jgi:hypothetical protein
MPSEAVGAHEFSEERKEEGSQTQQLRVLSGQKEKQTTLWSSGQLPQVHRRRCVEPML